MKDITERPIPTMFADEEEICEHKNFNWECKECVEDRTVDYLIDIEKEKDD